ncbi:MAG: purine-binding chemotaxis protein CheW [Bacteroidales bacterium]|jgi:purine-binding chemotaxis protein CheW|nr:purine-binding chemotaxis protein CheW [Bacteroidales bacterium]MBR6278892.1 purine-binding chemotaxis protein CheW [Bacteroidales bacterium]
MSETYSNTISYLSFYLNGELYAFKVSDVIEVIELQKVTLIPKTPPHILGVINFRGEILPLIDVRKICGLKTDKNFDENQSVIIVLETGKDTPENLLTVSCMADAVSDVIDVKMADIMSIPDFDAKIKAEYTEGIFEHNGDYITILNSSAIFSINNGKK